MIKDLKFEEIESILEEMVEEFLDGISENCDENGNVDFGNGVNYKNKEDLLEDFILYIKNFIIQKFFYFIFNYFFHYYYYFILIQNNFYHIHFLNQTNLH